MEGSGALFGRGLGRDLEPLGASWVVLGSPFFTLVFGVVVKSALGGTSAGLWLDFQGFGEDFGRVLGRLGRDFRAFWAILGYSGLFWAILGYWAVFGCSSQDFCRCCLLLAAPQLEFEFKISSCFCLLLFAWACVCITKYGTHFELKLLLALLLAFAFFCLLWLALACFGLLWLALVALAALSVPLLPRFIN